MMQIVSMHVASYTCLPLRSFRQQIQNMFSLVVFIARSPNMAVAAAMRPITNLILSAITFFANCLLL